MTIDWRLLPSATYAYDETKDQGDILKPFRDAAYEGGIPWSMGRPTITWSSISPLLRSMALTFTTPQELHTLFDALDQARQHGFPTATASAGDALIARAEGKRGALPLPDGWIDRARVASSHGRNSSAAYWANAMLRGAGLHVDPGRDEPHQGVA